MTASLTESSVKQYNSVLKHWWSFYQQNNLNPFKADEKVILECLTNRFSEGANYRTLNTLRWDISLINDQERFSKEGLVQRFFKSIYTLRPHTPRYESTWDVNIVHEKLEEWSPVETLDLRKLSLKSAMLLALGSAFRVQSLSLISTENVNFTTEGVRIRITDPIKTSRPGSSQPHAFFADRPKICVAKTLQEYLRRTRKIPNRSNNLFLSFREPFKKIGPQTVSRWLKTVMTEAGIHEEFKGQSTSTSKAWSRGLDMNKIKEVAGLTKASTTFARFYRRSIKNATNEFAEIIFN